ncbi:MAG: PaaI family thioesterase [Streptomycetales bacterium]
MTRHGITPGERFEDVESWEGRAGGPHVWQTLGYRRLSWEPGVTTIEWDAPVEYCFPTAGGPVVQGGLVSALLDAAMGGACWTVLDRDQVFLTADLRVEFLRTSRPGLLRATGEVVRRTRRVVFCSAEMHDDQGKLLAASRCTQVVLPAEGRAGRYGQPVDDPTGDGGPPLDARG